MVSVHSQFAGNISVIRHNPVRALWFPDKVDTKLYFNRQDVRK